MLTHAQGVARERALAAQADRDAARRAAWGRRGRRTAWNAGLSGFSAEMEDAICVGLMMGKSLTALCREPGMPSIGTVYNWLRAHPGFVEGYRRAREVQAETLAEEAIETMPPAAAGLRATNRHFRTALRAAGWVKLRRYAAPRGPQALTVLLASEDEASATVIYEQRRG
ncbi:MAG TPA: hypothetical protein VFE18_07535, partial [Phenylobacterium sp.]|uniref:terminase small subunit-like protein n=1 Tax=Phenylobacterium sp. TaxID=1871053 RepID=UPI002D71F27A